MVYLRPNGSPNMTLSRNIRGGWLAPYAHDGADRVAHWTATPPEQDHRRRPMTGDVGPAGVDDVAQVNGREELLDQLLTELPLHERVGRDLPREAALASQVEDPLHERHRERVLPIAYAGVTL